MSFDDEDGKRVTCSRVGPVADPRALVVGVWRCPHYTEKTAFERYHMDGRFEFRLVLAPSGSGTWKTEGTTLHVLDGAAASRYEIRHDGGVLSLAHAGAGRASSTAYRRTDRWYEFPGT